MTERLSAEQMDEALAFARSCTAANEKCMPCRALIQADQDARRYRFVRANIDQGIDTDGHGICGTHFAVRNIEWSSDDNALDAAIDAAIDCAIGDDHAAR